MSPTVKFNRDMLQFKAKKLNSGQLDPDLNTLAVNLTGWASGKNNFRK